MDTKTTTFRASRAVRETVLLDYEPLLRGLVASQKGEDGEVGPLRLSDKIVAQMCEVSERQVRRARLEGLDPYLADHMCVKGLGLHPLLIFGDSWMTAQAFWAEDIYNRKIDPENLPSFEDALADIWAEMDAAVA